MRARSFLWLLSFAFYFKLCSLSPSFHNLFTPFTLWLPFHWLAADNSCFLVWEDQQFWYLVTFHWFLHCSETLLSPRICKNQSLLCSHNGNRFHSVDMGVPDASTWILILFPSSSYRVLCKEVFSEASTTVQGAFWNLFQLVLIYYKTPGLPYHVVSWNSLWCSGSINQWIDITSNHRNRLLICGGHSTDNILHWISHLDAVNGRSKEEAPCIVV